MGRRIFPPPNLVALVIAAEDEVQIAIAVDVENRAARFDGEKIFFDDVAVPTLRRAAIPDQRGRLLPETEHEIVHPIAVKIGNDGAGLLRGFAGHGQITVLAGEMLPFDFRGTGGQTKRGKKRENRRGAPDRSAARKVWLVG